MPYLVKVGSKSTAVATLEEARSVVGYASCLPSGRHITNGREITESGGTVGPLPDGTVVEVEPATAQAIFDALPSDTQAGLIDGGDEDGGVVLVALLAAYNTKQAT